MINKQYFTLWLLSFLFLAGAAFLPAQAQQKEKLKAATGNKAKVKILKQEGEAYYLLDTTITMVEGKSMSDAVKLIQADSISFKILGAKKINPVRISSGKGFEAIRYFPSRPNDSLRTTVFRIIGPDSVHTRINAVRVYGGANIEVDSLRGSKPRAISIYRSPDVAHLAITIDSLDRGQRFIRVDSTLRLRADTFLLRETVRVESDGKREELRIIRQNKNMGDKILETGDYEVIRLKKGDHSRVIILQATKGKGDASKKQEIKGRRKKEALKAAQVDLNFYPNPTSGRVTVSFSSPKKAKAQVRVVDSLGKTVYQEDLGQVEGQLSRELNLARFGKGIYVIQVQIGKTAQSGKVVVE